MSFLSVLKEVGAVIVWPFKHAVMLEELTATFKKDEPELQALFIGLVKQFDAIGADTMSAIASSGTNLPADLADEAAVVALFKYVQQTALPTIREAYTDFKLASEGKAPTAPAPAPAPDPAPAAPAVAAAADSLRVSPNARPTPSGAPLAPE